MKQILAVLSVIMFANQANADEVELDTGDIYYCELFSVYQLDFEPESNKIVDAFNNPKSSMQRKFIFILTDEYLRQKKIEMHFTPRE